MHLFQILFHTNLSRLMAIQVQNLNLPKLLKIIE